MDMAQLMQMAGQLKTQLGDAQKAAEQLEVSGEAGGGLVQVTVNGQHRVTRVKIDPSLLQQDSGGLLEDLVAAAVNKASASLAEQMKEKLGGVGAGLGLDPSLFGGFGG